MQTFKSSQFDQDPKTGILSEEASTLRFEPERHFKLLNEKTGREIVFRSAGGLYHEGDLLEWHYIPNQRKYDGIQRIVIFND